ncbi:hypothetical protein [Sphingomonas jatrophae]|uniref:Uncharacterized protein n=1 Tax=Sphingomonas jatrophae TaxID=1166337 RepID=A0A1I6KEN3_9SPHN|nr:hypothetical protein [Sphingomonas jatrophae]SFR89498.1 hypothetical protein SAMN05192580_1627 [Sphingomonas jatrophae]
MSEIDHALSQLAFIQDRMAASTRFRGLAPVAVAGTGVLAAAVAAAQSLGFAGGHDAIGFVLSWTVTAVAAAGLIGVEALDRARRLHAGMPDTMLAGTLRLLLPFGAVGAVATLVIVQSAPQVIWILPGLWQLLIALIGFSAAGTLPKAIMWPAGWYFLCGTATLLIAARSLSATPWMMGVPFGIGQILVAVILHRAGGRDGRR